MGDNFEQDPGDVAKTLGRIRARDAQLWGRKVATADVTPGMLEHHNGSRCLCEACDGMRVQRRLPPTLHTQVLVNRSKRHRLLRLDSGNTPELEERTSEPRKSNRLNTPIQAPELNERQISFLMRLKK